MLHLWFAFDVTFEITELSNAWRLNEGVYSVRFQILVFFCFEFLLDYTISVPWLDRMLPLRLVQLYKNLLPSSGRGWENKFRSKSYLKINNLYYYNWKFHLRKYTNANVILITLSIYQYRFINSIWWWVGVCLSRGKSMRWSKLQTHFFKKIRHIYPSSMFM